MLYQLSFEAGPQVAKLDHMSSSMLTCALLRNVAFCIFIKICMGKEINPKKKKKRKITVELQ